MSAPSTLLEAAFRGDRDETARLAADRQDLNLFEAAATGDVRSLQRSLAEDPAALSEFTPDGFTALGLAAYFGQLEAVRTLLTAGADPQLGQTAPGGYFPIHSALAGNHTEIVALLLQNGADPNEPNDSDWTPLHYAAENSNVEVAKLLLDAGARGGYTRNDGLTALDVAERNGPAELVALIRDAVV